MNTKLDERFRKRVKSKRKSKGKIIALSFFMLLFVILIASYLRNQNPRPKEPASSYFKIYPIYFIGDLLEPGTWRVYEIIFDIQPVGGDANNVVIESWAMSDPEELGDILKNQSKRVHLTSRFGDVVKVNSDGKIPITIRVKSEEAEGKITLLFQPPQT